jgi:hypothetical protein
MSAIITPSAHQSQQKPARNLSVSGALQWVGTPIVDVEVLGARHRPTTLLHVVLG